MPELPTSRIRWSTTDAGSLATLWSRLAGALRRHTYAPLVVLAALTLAACAGHPAANEAVGERADALSTVTTDKSSYVSTDSVVATFSGASGSANDWVSISVPGSPATSYLLWNYVGSAC